MKIIKIDNSFQPIGEIAATTGFFDGVHSGHRYLIDQLKILAETKGLPAAVVTFSQHPKITLQTGYVPDLLNTLDEKLYQLSTTGIDYCFILDFTKELSLLDARTFIQEKLYNQLHVKQLLIGHDHRFGKNRTESFADYVKYGKACGMEIVRALELPDLHVSSTVIRKQLADRQLKEANQLLSYNYSLEGKVIAGNRLGREIGFPTANLELSDVSKVVPGTGVYAAWVYVDHQKYPGMIYIGKRPTVTNQGETRIEAHILDFSGDLYGKTLRLEFVGLIREEKQFSGLGELKKQLVKDKNDTQSVLSGK
jgi:riboflavin kinase/FMN adenylyltransferase